MTGTTPARVPPYWLGIDVGGTNTKAGIVDDNGHVLSKTHVPTEPRKGPDAGIQMFCRVADLAIQEAGLTRGDIKGAGLATPGTMDIKAGMLVAPPNLPGWDNFPVRLRTEEALGIPTILQNDANAAAFGEFWAGAGKEADSLVLFTLGTGIGSGIIIHDVIIEGEHSNAAECGHIIIDMSPTARPHAGTGMRGTLEAYAGAKALVDRCHEALTRSRKSSLRPLLANGAELTPLMIAEEAEKGDELCFELVMETARCIGAGTVNLMHTIDPDMVLYGGAMTFGAEHTALGRRFLEEIRKFVEDRAFPIPYQRTKLAFASLGGDAGFIGAAGCARRKFK